MPYAPMNFCIWIYVFADDLIQKWKWYFSVLHKAKDFLLQYKLTGQWINISWYFTCGYGNVLL